MIAHRFQGDSYAVLTSRIHPDGSTLAIIYEDLNDASVDKDAKRDWSGFVGFEQDGRGFRWACQS